MLSGIIGLDLSSNPAAGPGFRKLCRLVPTRCRTHLDLIGQHAINYAGMTESKLRALHGASGNGPLFADILNKSRAADLYLGSER
jgi:hypothetical protein